MALHHGQNPQLGLKNLGADAVINHNKPLSEELAQLDIADVTHVISLTQTDKHFDEIVKVLRPQGKLALIDDPIGPLDVMKLKRKSLSLHWELMFTRSLYQTEDMIAQHHLLNRIAELIDTGAVKAPLVSITALSMRKTCLKRMLK